MTDRLQAVNSSCWRLVLFQTSQTFFKNITQPIDWVVKFLLLDKWPPYKPYDFCLYVDLYGFYLGTTVPITKLRPNFSHISLPYRGGLYSAKIRSSTENRWCPRDWEEPSPTRGVLAKMLAAGTVEDFVCSDKSKPPIDTVVLAAVSRVFRQILLTAC